MLIMQRTFYLMACFIISIHVCNAQDTIKINGQPNWVQWVDIADHTFFYEEQPGTAIRFDKALSFEVIKTRPFVPYSEKLRQQKFAKRPLIIQWLKFSISNTAATDTIHLYLGLSPHYFVRLYSNNQLLVRDGAYETNPTYPGFGSMPIEIAPLSTVTFWLRTEDRMNQLVPNGIALGTPYLFMEGMAIGIARDRLLFLMLAALSGCLIFITLYAIYQYYLYRDTAFVWYIGYSISALFTALFWLDIRHHLRLFPALFHDLMLAVFVFVAPVFYTFFIGSMLQLPVHFKKGWMIVKCFVAIALAQMLIEFTTIRTGWFLLNPDWYSTILSVVPLLLLHITLLVLTALSKDRVKWFLFSGVMSLLILWCLPIIGGGYAISFKETPLFMILIFPPAFMILGLVVEAVCFSFALTYRSKLIFVEKNQLKENYNYELEKALQQRTLELQQQSNLLEAQKIKQVQTEFEHKIAETEMTALRAQMNPHFIFNCLNSIKLYTLENDSQTASEYLTKFSQLIRLVLENSRSEKVTLQKELETLKLYIELEAMRFKDKVQYKINVVPHIDQQYIEIPPLLLQPYVENAIWHGLMHKPEGGNISIDIHQPSEYLLHIEISDDGIGREKAKEHKSKSATRQKSFGLKMTSERLDAINHIYQTNTEVKIIDLEDENGNAAGTKVIIEIPL